jgi:hypothetical protein
MIIKPSSLVSSRRGFLLNVLPVGTLFCLGCGSLSALTGGQDTQKTGEQKHKFQEDSGMTIEGILKYANETYVPILQTLANDVGREKFLDMLRKASVENITQLVSAMAKDFPTRDLAAFADMMTMIVFNSFPTSKMLTYEIVQKTDKVFEVKATECLAAKLFREMKAEDIGISVFCHPWCDNPISQAFNPKIIGSLPKNLMKGDDVCIARFVLEG